MLGKRGYKKMSKRRYKRIVGTIGGKDSESSVLFGLCSWQLNMFQMRPRYHNPSSDCPV